MLWAKLHTKCLITPWKPYTVLHIFCKLHSVCKIHGPFSCSMKKILHLTEKLWCLWQIWGMLQSSVLRHSPSIMVPIAYNWSLSQNSHVLIWPSSKWEPPSPCDVCFSFSTFPFLFVWLCISCWTLNFHIFTTELSGFVSMKKQQCRICRGSSS